MEIYLIRHTTPKIGKGICYGQTDLEVEITFFEKELQAIQQKLPDTFDQVYTSPLMRCQQLAKRLDDRPVLDERLMELNFGDWENKSWGDINQTELNAWMQDFVHTKASNGESYLDLHQRTLDFIDMLSNEHKDRIAIVTHAGNIRSFVSYVLDLPLENSFRIQLKYGSVVRVALGQSAQFHQLHLDIK